MHHSNVGSLSAKASNKNAFGHRGDYVDVAVFVVSDVVFCALDVRGTGIAGAKVTDALARLTYANKRLGSLWGGVQLRGRRRNEWANRNNELFAVRFQMPK